MDSEGFNILIGSFYILFIMALYGGHVCHVLPCLPVHLTISSSHGSITSTSISISYLLKLIADKTMLSKDGGQFT